MCTSPCLTPSNPIPFNSSQSPTTGEFIPLINVLNDFKCFSGGGRNTSKNKHVTKSLICIFINRFHLVQNVMHELVSNLKNTLLSKVLPLKCILKWPQVIVNHCFKTHKMSYKTIFHSWTKLCIYAHILIYVLMLQFTSFI